MQTQKPQISSEQPLTKKKKKEKKKPTRKDNLHPKMKKPQQDGRSGTIRIKSSPILTGWALRKQEANYVTEILPQKWKP